jgi:hypothetical protein
MPPQRSLQTGNAWLWSSNQDLWKENPIHSAASKRGDKLRQQRPGVAYDSDPTGTRVLRFQCRSRSESRQASLVMCCVLTLRMRISDWALETVCAAAAGISSEGRRRCNRLPNYKVVLGRSRDGDHGGDWCTRWKTCLAVILGLRRDH